jgi:transposase
MLGTADPQPSMFYYINLEQYVPADHPMRKIRPLIDTDRIRTLCEPLYSEVGRPSIPAEQLFLALLGGYLLGVTSERALVRELTGNLVLRWFVGLDLDQMPWDHSTFSQNRKRRFTESGLLERLFDEIVALAIKQKLRSHHTTLDGTLVQANASHKSFVPMEVFLKPAEYTRRIRSLDAGSEPDQDPGNPTATGRGERRSNQTHVSTTDPDAKLANKGNGTASETDGGRALLDRFHVTYDRRIQTVGADKGYFSTPFLRRSCGGESSRTLRPKPPDGRRCNSGWTGKPDGGLPPLTAGTKENQRTLG